MMRSMYSGVAGLKTHQTRMDVIGNNIANVNTVGYKSQSALFTELLYQNSSAASGPNDTTRIGGINAKQVGLGVKMGSISTNITLPGSAETTNNPFDLCITGDSFFVVNNGRDNMFTRDGSFKVDAAGNLVMSSTGYYVMGWQTDNKGDIKPDTVSALKIMNEANMTYPPEGTTQAYVSGIVDETSPEIHGNGKIMNLNFFDSRGYSYTQKLIIRGPKQEVTTSNTDVRNRYTCQLGELLDADGKVVSPAGIKLGVGGNYGSSDQAICIDFDKSDGSFVGVADDAGTTTRPTSQTATLYFDDPATASTGAVNFTDITIDFSTLSNVGNEGVSTASATNGSLDNKGGGRKIGKMSGLSIERSGKIYAAYDNGQTKLLGQIAAASFANPSGLQKEGDNLYIATQNSGDFDGIGIDITSDGGYMTSGELEMSNVDLSGELTGMIVTQRGFQANSRIITVSDTMLEELINLKR